MALPPLALSVSWPGDEHAHGLAENLEARRRLGGQLAIGVDRFRVARPDLGILEASNADLVPKAVPSGAEGWVDQQALSALAPRVPGFSIWVRRG